MKYCPNCGRELADETKFCGGCGTEQQGVGKRTDSNKKTSKGKGVLSVMIAVIVIAVVVVIMFGTKAKEEVPDKTEEKSELVEENKEKAIIKNEVEETELIYKCIETRCEWIADAESSYIVKGEYDENGNILKDTFYDLEGNMDYAYVYTYGEDGNLLEVTVYDKNDNPTKSKEEYSYDANGIQRNYRKLSNGIVEKEEAYDENGNLQNRIFYNDGKIENCQEYSYDSNGNKISEKDYWYTQNGEKYMSSLFEYTYDENSLLAKEEVYDLVVDDSGEYMELKYYTEYAYDIQGNIVEERYCSFDKIYGSNGIKKYTYDTECNLLAVECFDQDNSLTGYVKYTYDTQGNCVTIKYFGENNILETWIEGTYDDAGNMLSKIRYSTSGEMIEKVEFIYEAFEVKKN